MDVTFLATVDKLQYVVSSFPVYKLKTKRN